MSIDGKDDNLVGLLMVDRPCRISEEWLNNVEKKFGDYQLLPMTFSGDKGIVCQMKIKKDSLKYLKEFPFLFDENIADSLYQLLFNKPNPKLRVWWDDNYRLWLSEFDI